MNRPYPFWLVASAILTIIFAADFALAQSPWETYWESIQRRRELAGRRYDDWRQRQQDFYQQRRFPAGQPADADVQVQLRDPFVPPGDYRIQLPFGLQARVQVQTPPGAAPPQRGGAFYSQVASLSARITDDLRDIRYGVYQTNRVALQEQVDQAVAVVDQLERMALERADRDAIAQQFQEFDRQWHQLAHELAAQNYLNAAWIRREVESVNQNDAVLHQLFQIGEAPIYDRLRVVALTKQLADTTGHLLEDVEFEARDNPQVDLLRRRVDRVRRLAADLEAAVAQDASFASIVEEYEQFDQAWHRLMRTARQIPGISDHLLSMGQRINTIDRELHRELRVDAPLVADPAQMRNLAQSVAQQADHLAEDLRYSLGDRNRDIVRNTELFASAVRRLQQAIDTPAQDEARAAQQAERFWNAVHDRLHDLDNQRVQHAKEMAHILEEDFNRLLTMVEPK